ncbi:VOC family protein [Ferrimicrobium sp.]|uniref:VOC family protein n=1 Tax=Ferrimicrobium sp. TaxID=2926050 RepID=UPI0026294740|nr:VOC family protein [Ferrimicrobium sp.]
MASRLFNIAVGANNPHALAEFWCQVLGWDVIEDDEVFDYVSIGSPDHSLPVIDFLKVPDLKSRKNRLHLDLRADGTTTKEELARLEGLGARRVDIGQGPDVSWIVLADPEGNEFCLLGKTAQEFLGAKA